MGLFGRIKTWIETRAVEDEIKSLSDRELKDIGMTRYDAALLVKESLSTQGIGR